MTFVMHRTDPMRARRAPLLALALVCATPAAAQPDAAVRIDGDKFSKLVTFTGATFGKNSFLGTSRTYHIRSWIDRGAISPPAHQLYVDIDYVDGRRLYERAADDDADDLELTRLAFDKDSPGCTGLCGYSETIGIGLPETLLRAKAVTGFQIKLYARSGDTLVLDIPAEEIAAQLKAVDDYRNHPIGDTSALLRPPSPIPPFGVSFGTAKPIWGLPGGALVGTIASGSVAARSGLHWADTIISWDGHVIASAADIEAQLALVRPGARVPYKALRGRKTHDLVAEF